MDFLVSARDQINGPRNLPGSEADVVASSSLSLPVYSDGEEDTSRGRRAEDSFPLRLLLRGREKGKAWTRESSSERVSLEARLGRQV